MSVHIKQKKSTKHNYFQLQNCARYVFHKFAPGESYNGDCSLEGTHDLLIGYTLQIEHSSQYPHQNTTTADKIRKHVQYIIRILNTALWKLKNQVE